MVLKNKEDRQINKGHEDICALCCVLRSIPVLLCSVMSMKGVMNHRKTVGDHT